MKLKMKLKMSILLMALLMTITPALAFDSVNTACDTPSGGCHAFPPVSLNNTVSISQIQVSPGQTFPVTINWTGGVTAGTNTVAKWPSDVLNNSLFSPAPVISAVEVAPTGKLTSTLTAPLTSGNYTIRAYTSAGTGTPNTGKETDYKNIVVKVQESVVPVLNSIGVSPATSTMAINAIQIFNATALDQNGAPIQGITIDWTSNNTAVGNVSPLTATTDIFGGATTTFTASAAGVAMVTANNGTTMGSANVTVTEVAINGTIAGTVTNVSSGLGIPATVTADTLSNNTDVNGNYSISIAPGTYTVTASATGYQTSTTTSVVVTSGNVTTQNFELAQAQKPLDIKLSPSSATLNVTDTQTFNATALDDKNNPVSGIVITFTSSNTTVGTVSPLSGFTGPDGNASVTFTANGAGDAFVNATNASATANGSATVTVTNPTPLPITKPVVITLKVSPSDAGIVTITSPIGTTTTSTSTKITIPSGSKVTFNVTPNERYRFDRFVDKWNGKTFTTSLNPWTDTMESNDVVTAVLVPTTVVDTIRVSPEGAGTVQAVSAVGTTTTPPTTTLIIPVNSKVKFKAIPNKGFKFDHWLDTWGISSSFTTKQNPWTDTMSSSDITTAVFVPIRKFGGNDDGNDKQGNIDHNKGMDDSKTD